MRKSTGWPKKCEYAEAIQNPHICFDDDELKRGRAKTYQEGSQKGLPKPESGNFAVVFQLRSDGRLFAVKCFFRAVTDLRKRYEELSQHLSGISMDALVDFAYLHRGIRVRGQWYPVVRMEWAPGKQLHHYVKDHLRQGQALERLAARFRGVVAGFSGSHMAHGDLQHGNILVDGQGQIKLVDYDGFFIPALRGHPSGEVGHTSYQHPERIRKGYYEENADAFSSLVIYLSLLALRVDSGLWTSPHGDNLIFEHDDFKAPGRTSVWGRLERSPDAKVRHLTAELERFCREPVSAMPDLEAVLQRLPGSTSPLPLEHPSSKGVPDWIASAPQTPPTPVEEKQPPPPPPPGLLQSLWRGDTEPYRQPRRFVGSLGVAVLAGLVWNSAVAVARWSSPMKTVSVVLVIIALGLAVWGGWLLWRIFRLLGVRRILILLSVLYLSVVSVRVLIAEEERPLAEKIVLQMQSTASEGWRIMTGFIRSVIEAPATFRFAYTGQSPANGVPGVEVDPTSMKGEIIEPTITTTLDELTPAVESTPAPTEFPKTTQILTPASLVRPELMEPQQGETLRNPILFEWRGSLSAGQSYQVKAWPKNDGEHTVQSDLLMTSSWSTDLPAELYGEWCWQVSVVSYGSVAATSTERFFWFNPYKE